MDSLTKVHGVSTKTFTVTTINGLNTYTLGDYQTDNFGVDAQVIGVSMRSGIIGIGTGPISIDGRPLIGPTVVKGGYLYLVRDDTRRTNLLYAENLNFLLRAPANISNQYDIFFPACVVNWNETYVEFAPSITIDGTKDMEFTVYFITPCSKPSQANYIYDNKQQYPALKKRTIQVNTQAGRQKFLLSDGRNPLSTGDLLVGMYFNFFQHVALDDSTEITLGQYLGATFLTMKVGNRLLMEDFPIRNLHPFNHLGLPYFPIEPTLAEDFDWTGCKLFVSDKSVVLDNKSYLITLFYI